MTFSDSETDSDLGIVPLKRKQMNENAWTKTERKNVKVKNQVKKKRKKRMNEVELLNYRKWE